MVPTVHVAELPELEPELVDELELPDGELVDEPERVELLDEPDAFEPLDPVLVVEPPEPLEALFDPALPLEPLAAMLAELGADVPPGTPPLSDELELQALPTQETVASAAIWKNSFVLKMLMRVMRAVAPLARFRHAR
jgi:hypothetical protein